MQSGNWSGTFAHWWLADALKWRADEFSVSLDKAFAELRVLMTAPSDRRLVATAIACEHACRMPDIRHYEAFRDPPTTHKKSTFALATMPAVVWADLLPTIDAAGQPTSDLKCASCRLPAWLRVEFLDRYALVKAWSGKPVRSTRRGPLPVLQDSMAARMLDELCDAKTTEDELEGMKLAALSATYGGSNNTAKAARTQALAEFRSKKL